MVALAMRHQHDNVWSAHAKEERWNWLGAASNYRKSVKKHLASKNFVKAGEAQERVGLCLYRAAFQSETPREFKRRIRAATDAYQMGAEIFKKTDGHRSTARISCCKASATYAKYWVAKRASTKRRLLHECCVLAKKALNKYESFGDKQGLVKVCNDLVLYLDDSLGLVSRKSDAQKLLKESDYCCERALEASLALGDEYEIARAYYNVGRHYRVSVFLRPLTGKTEKNRQEALGYLQRAKELFEKVNDDYLSVLASLDFAYIANSRITLDPNLGMEHFEQLSSQGAEMRDNYVIACASLWLAFHSWWMMRLEQDSEKKRHWYQKCAAYADKAMHHSNIVSDDCGTALACWIRSYAEHAFAEELETQPNARRLRLEESINIARKGVKHAERSGVLEAAHFTKNALCLAHIWLSDVETDLDKRKDALEEALKRGEECVEAAKAGIPYDFWNIGLNHCFLALTLLKQAELELDRAWRKQLRKKASLHWIEGKKLTSEYLALYPDAKRYWGLGGLSLRYGESLNQLHRLTGRKDILQEVVKVYSESASMFGQVGASSMVAQAQWQIAKTFDLLERFSDAAGYFSQASQSFRAAAEKMPLMKYWHIENALYMLAWKEIEEAKLCSSGADHSKSAEHYRKASTCLNETVRWRYLSPYYLALSLVELGEHCKKRKELEEANRTFAEAAASFEQARVLLKGREGFAESSEEREEILKLGRIADVKGKTLKKLVTIEDAYAVKALPQYPESAAGLNAFEDACVRARVTAPKDFAVGRETRIRLDLVNIGRKPGVVIRIEKMVPSSFCLLETSPACTLEGESLRIEGKLLAPLQTLSLGIKVRPAGFDAIELGPRVVYVNYHGDFVVYDVEPVLMRPSIIFESKPAHEVFTYLVDAFKEDYEKKGMPLERSGWRTRTQILSCAKGIHKRHVYGTHGQLGPIILRLNNQGLIDVDIATGGRSRGGLLTKFRIVHENEAVKRYIARMRSA